MSSITITPFVAAAMERDPEFKEMFARQVRAFSAFDRLVHQIADEELKSAIGKATQELTNASSAVATYVTYLDANAQLAEAGHKAASTTTLNMPDVIFSAGAIQLQLPPGGLDVNVHQEPRSVSILRDDRGQMIGVSDREA